MELIDSDAHVYGEEYAEDLPQVVDRAGEAVVTTMVAVGADLASSRQALALTTAHPHIYCSAGIHPHDADGVTEESYQTIREMALSSSKVVAIGEVGLDFYRDRSPRPAQEAVFRRFIRLARELSLPLV